MSYTPIKLDKTRNFRFGMKAMSIIEKKFKTTISKIDFDDLTMEDMATIIWAGLVHEDKELTTDDVMELIDEHSNIQTVFEIVGEAFNDSMGVTDTEENSEKAKN